jgi:hypothetical protein
VPPDHEITEVRAGHKLLFSVEAILEANYLSVGYPEPPVDPGRNEWCRGRVTSWAAGGLGPASPRVHGLILAGMGSLEGTQDILPRAGAGINQTITAKPLKGAPVPIDSLALAVGGIGTAEIGSLLPLNAEPVQVFEHGSNVFRSYSRAIQILVSQDQRACVGVSPFLRNPEGAGMS